VPAHDKRSRINLKCGEGFSKILMYRNGELRAMFRHQRNLSPPVSWTASNEKLNGHVGSVAPSEGAAAHFARAMLCDAS
jgi:hypothetical protein